jgi:DNA mismatch repair ATPase MutS
LQLTDYQYILQSKTDKSLIVIDEMGRSTSPVEGPSLCWALLEPLVKSKATVVLATHCRFLTTMADMYFNIFL